MPKRIKTPPPPDDEPRYLTVVHPYPLNANLDLHADRRTLALWLACCADKDVLLAMYHKPASPSMIIIEVDRDFDRFNDLLGMHSWSKFLLNPTPEESDKSSKIFWCAHNSGRAVQKYGWKRVDIQGYWFEGWSKQNLKIRYPYPQTTYCDVPSEAKTGEPLCRPLPQSVFPAPPRPPPPVVGSPAWLAARNGDATPGTTTPLSRDGRKKVTQGGTASTTNSGSRNAQSPPPPTPVSAMANYRASQNAFKRGPPSTPSSTSSFASSRAGSAINSPQRTSTGSSNASTPAPATPPGFASRLTPRIKQPLPEIGPYQSFNWSDEVSAPPTPTSSSVSGSLRSDGYKSPPQGFERDPGGPIDPTQQYEYYEEDKPKRTMAAAMGDLFGDVPLPTLAKSSAARGRGCVQDEHPEGDYENLWPGYNDPRQEAPTRIRRVKKANKDEKGKEEWICDEHGPMCSPGICKARAAFEFGVRKEIEKKKREEDKQKWLAKKSKRKPKDNAENDKDSLPRYGNTPRMGHSVSDDSSDESTGTEGGPIRTRDERNASREPSLPPASPSGSTNSARPPKDHENDEDDEDLRCSMSVAGEDYDDENEETDGERDEMRSVMSARTSTTAVTSTTNISRRSTSSSGQRSLMSVRTTASFAKATSGPVVDLTTAAVTALGAQSKKSKSQSQYSPAAGRRKPVSSDARSTSSTAVSSASSSAQTNFPSYDGTRWGDPIATAQAAAKKVGKKPGRARKHKAKQWVDAQPILEVEVPEGGPNGAWAPEDVEF